MWDKNSAGIERKRKRRIRNIICIQYCMVELVLVVLAFELLGNALQWLQEKSQVNPVMGSIIEDIGNPQGENGLVVCIDAGHGGKDNGSDYRKRMEKDDNLKLAKAVASYLKAKNVTVVMTREDDTFLSLEARCDFANQKKADYFVSLHRNDGEGNGVETWISNGAPDETNALADNIMEKLEAAGIQRNRGVKEGTQKSEKGGYYVNLHSDMPSCIVEMGFIGNSADNQLFDEKLDAYAAAIGDAVLKTDAAYGNRQNGEPAGADGVGEAENGTQRGASGKEMVSAIDPTGLDAASRDWGQGVHMDEKNRPIGALDAQGKYGDKNAVFIGADTQEIYLTFDEGYEYGCTEIILNTLKEKGVRAVFFVTEPYAKAEPELVRRMIDEGHVVGNHSVTHPADGLPSLSVEKQQEEVLGNHRYISENFGYEMSLFRYPAGKFSEQSLAIVNNCGYKSLFWSFAYLDYDVANQPDRAESLAKLTERLHPGAVYLLHAESETNAAVLGAFIDAAREKGYIFSVIE